jgi:hypothetical protein
MHALIDGRGGSVSDVEVSRRLWGESCDDLALLGIFEVEELKMNEEEGENEVVG